MHIPNYLDADEVQMLRPEFRDFFECSETWVKQMSYRPGWLSKAVAVQHDDIDEPRFPLTGRIFGSDFMAAICDGYLGVPNQLNNAIYLTHDLPNPEPVTILHFDRIYALKFYFYLSDTSRKNGAFEFIPGSHKRGREIRCSYLRKGVRVEDISIWDLPKERPETIPIESPAGTLIIFDTDGFHGGVLFPKVRRE